LIKIRFPKSLPDEEWRFATRLRRGERGIWQRRCCEHLIRDDQDFAANMEYIHINPLKHRLVRWVADWRFSTFHHLEARGVYPLDRTGEFEGDVDQRSQHAAQCAALIDALPISPYGLILNTN
jgi:putative transposase